MKLNRHLVKLLKGLLFTTLIVGLTIPSLAAANSRTVTITNDSIKLVVNGQTITTKDKNGTVLEPVFIDGVAYLPAQSIGDAMNLDYTWDSATKEMKFSSKASLVANDISLEKAKQIALEHAGVQAAAARFFKAELDYDDGHTEYEIEFYSGTVEYDYAIDPQTGTILSWDHDVEGYQAPTQGNGTTTQTILTLEQAKTRAIAKAPNAILQFCRLDYDDGKQIYEGKLREGQKEYEFELDAVSGDFLKWEVDYDD